MAPRRFPVLTPPRWALVRLLAFVFALDGLGAGPLGQAAEAPSTPLTFSSDPRRAVPVLAFSVTNWFGPAPDAVIYVKHHGGSPVSGLSVLNLKPPFFLKDGLDAGVASACGSSITGDCTLVLTFDHRRAGDADYSMALDRRRYMARIQFEYVEGAVRHRSSNFVLVGHAPGLVRSLSFTYNPLRFIPSLVGGRVLQDTAISLREFGAVRKVRWLDQPAPPFSFRLDTCDPARIYRRTATSNDPVYLTVAFQPTNVGRFQQVLRLSFDNGLGEQVVPLTLEGEAFLPTASEQVLVVYDALSPDSVALKDYYLAHRPGFRTVNVLPVSIGLDRTQASLEIIPRPQYEELIVAPLTRWIRAHPEKRIGYVVLLHGIPTMRSWRHEGDWAFDGLQFALMQDLGAIEGYVPPPNYARATLHAALPLVTHLFTGSIEGARAYVDKLEAMAARMPQPGLILSSRNTGTAGTTYYLDDFATPGTIGHIAGGFGSGIRAEFAAKAPEARIQYGPKTGPGISRGEDVAGYFGWGLNGGRGRDYAVDGSIQFLGHSGWYLIQTAESFNGRLDRETYQGSFEKWFARGAFGGTNFSHIPVGAVGHVVEPGLPGINNPAYFWSWENGQTLADCAWFSAGATTKLLVIGDPLVRR